MSMPWAQHWWSNRFWPMSIISFTVIEFILLKPRCGLTLVSRSQLRVGPLSALFQTSAPLWNLGMPNICEYCGFTEDSLYLGVGAVWGTAKHFTWAIPIRHISPSCLCAQPRGGSSPLPSPTSTPVFIPRDQSLDLSQLLCIWLPRPRHSKHKTL